MLYKAQLLFTTFLERCFVFTSFSYEETASQKGIGHLVSEGLALSDILVFFTMQQTPVILGICMHTFS